MLESKRGGQARGAEKRSQNRSNPLTGGETPVLSTTIWGANRGQGADARPIHGQVEMESQASPGLGRSYAALGQLPSPIQPVSR
jgi:hypothetical protein